MNDLELLELPRSSTQASERSKGNSPSPPNSNDGSARGNNPPSLSGTRDASYSYAPPPVYPKAAYESRVEGKVIIRAEVLSNGLIGGIQIHESSGVASLDREALLTAKKWRFNPAIRDGVPITQWVNIPVTFKLERK